MNIMEYFLVFSVVLAFIHYFVNVFLYIKMKKTERHFELII
jgi:hypothetical protein